MKEKPTKYLTTKEKRSLLKLAYERGDRDILNIVKKYESKINVISEVPFANRLNNSLGT